MWQFSEIIFYNRKYTVEIKVAKILAVATPEGNVIKIRRFKKNTG
jgi:hypothetical protein